MIFDYIELFATILGYITILWLIGLGIHYCILHIVDWEDKIKLWWQQKKYPKIRCYCKDCRYYDEYNKKCEGYCIQITGKIEPNFYCAYGIKKREII